MNTHVLVAGPDNTAIEFEMPETPIEAAALVASMLDEETGNSLNYPSIFTISEWADMNDDGDEA